MTGGAVRGADNDVYAMPVVVKGVLVGIRPERVALGTSHDGSQKGFGYAFRRDPSLQRRFLQPFLGGYPGMEGTLPVGYDPRRGLRVTGKALLRRIAHRGSAMGRET
jgi:hypothetical protein